MNNKLNTEYPITEELISSKKYFGIPHLSELNFNLWKLKIKLEFPNLQTPVYITFEDVQGFRVLNEGNLMEFWSNETRNTGWLWKVKKGGWHDQEKKRDGFFTGKAHLADYDEYMIAGVGMCLNLIGGIEPLIEQV